MNILKKLFLKTANQIIKLNRKKRISILICIDFLIVFLILNLAYFRYVFFAIDGNQLVNSITASVIALFIYFYTDQYKSITMYIPSSVIYKIIARNILFISLVSILLKPFGNLLIGLEAYLFVWVILTIFMLITRLILRDFLLALNRQFKPSLKTVVIYGAGKHGAHLFTSLRVSGGYYVRAFIDDKKELWGREIFGSIIHSPKILDQISNEIDEVYLAIPSLSRDSRQKIFSIMQNLSIPILQIPSFDDLRIGRATIEKLKPISLEDLLGREPIPPIDNLYGKNLSDRVVFVSGAGGSIGGELCTQIINLKPRKLILLELNEHSLYSIEKDLNFVNKKNIEIIPILGSATDYKLLKNIFIKFQVNIVFHAAAYKHVPLVEINPIAGLRNNVISTRVICSCAEDEGIDQVVLISSDKAVRPANVMGASKRLAELIVQAYSEKQSSKLSNLRGNKRTIFSMVRFGNVIGSSGSVIPLFKEQIKKGGPITITHPEIVRYFMTITEAAQLVLQASNLAEGGEVFLLDMGQPIKILDLAKQMISLSGLTYKSERNPNGDIEIIEKGLRPGEKLFEELLINAKAIRTPHPLIYRARESSILGSILFSKLDQLEDFLNDNNIKESLKILKELVPDWSNSLSECN